MFLLLMDYVLHTQNYILIWFVPYLDSIDPLDLDVPHPNIVYELLRDLVVLII